MVAMGFSQNFEVDWYNGKSVFNWSGGVIKLECSTRKIITIQYHFNFNYVQVNEIEEWN